MASHTELGLQQIKVVDGSVKMVAKKVDGTITVKTK